MANFKYSNRCLMDFVGEKNFPFVKILSKDVFQKALPQPKPAVQKFHDRNNFHEPRPRLDFAMQLHPITLQRSLSPNRKRKHQILLINYRNITRCIIITIIITIIIIMLITAIDQIATAIFFAQVKASFSSNTCAIIFITIIVNHSNTLLSEMSFFFLILHLLHQNFKHNLHRHSYPKRFPYRSRQLLIIYHQLNQLSS